jgi:catechol 2,3-dioxygenase-like lactoylglutathione lyase family enzyme
VTALDHFILKVNDLKTSLAFYTEVLGFSYEGMDGPFAVLRVSPSLVIQLAPFGTKGLEHFAFAMDRADFDQVVSRLAARGLATGATFDSVGKQPGLGRETGAKGPAPTLYFNDPDQHLLEIRAYDFL